MLLDVQHLNSQVLAIEYFCYYLACLWLQGQHDGALGPGGQYSQQYHSTMIDGPPLQQGFYPDQVREILSACE